MRLKFWLGLCATAVLGLTADVAMATSVPKGTARGIAPAAPKSDVELMARRRMSYGCDFVSFGAGLSLNDYVDYDEDGATVGGRGRATILFRAGA